MSPTPLLKLPIQFRVVRPGAEPPRYATDGAAAVDLHAHIDRPVHIYPGETFMIPTGIAVHIDNPNYVLLIYPRSGRATKEGLVLKNTVGVIDSDYQGEIFVAATNSDKQTPIYIKPGDRIAQMVLTPIVSAAFYEVKEFASESERGAGGFGSTGV